MIELDEMVAMVAQAWIAKGRGIARWVSINLSNPGVTWNTPAIDADGNRLDSTNEDEAAKARRALRPGWQAAMAPTEIEFDPHKIRVIRMQEVKRFRVAIRLGAQGLSFKLTDGSTRKLHKALAAAGNEARYDFDYDTQEAVVYQPVGALSMAQWKPDLKWKSKLSNATGAAARS